MKMHVLGDGFQASQLSALCRSKVVTKKKCQRTHMVLVIIITMKMSYLPLHVHRKR